MLGTATAQLSEASSDLSHGSPKAVDPTDSQKRLKSLSVLFQEFPQSSSSGQLLQALVQGVLESLDGVLAEVWETSENGELVRRAIGSQAGLVAKEPAGKVSEDYANRLRQLPGPYHGGLFPELPPELVGHETPTGVWAVPIELGGKTAGWLTLYRSTESDPLALDWFAAFARAAALAFDRSHFRQKQEKLVERLESVLEASKVLHSTLDLGELLALILKLATSASGADRGTVFLANSQTRELWSFVAMGLGEEEIRLPFGRGVAGHVAATGRLENLADAYQSSLFDASFDQRFGYRTRSLLCLPICNNCGEVLGILELLNKREGAFQQEDIDLLNTLSVHIALALENARRHQEVVARQRLERDLILARGIQNSLLPTTHPSLPGYEIGVLHESCFEVGGDYYDFLSVDANTLLAVADVEGKGVASALVMSNLQASLRALAMHHHSLEVIALSLNQMIRKDIRSQKFVSVFLGLLDQRGRGLHYVNAGHIPPLLIRLGDEVLRLTDGGVVMGLFDSPTYRRGKVQLKPGDVLVFCTDGIVEANDPNLQEYGMARLIEIVRRHRQRKAAELVNLICQDIKGFSRDSSLTDDRVLIVLKVSDLPGS